MHDDSEPHPGVADAAEFGALSFVAAWFIGLHMQDVHMSRHSVDLAGKAWNPEGVDNVKAADRDVDGNSCRQVQDIHGLHPPSSG